MEICLKINKKNSSKEVKERQHKGIPETFCRMIAEGLP
jgi:hypothetical protein